MTTELGIHDRRTMKDAFGFAVSLKRAFFVIVQAVMRQLSAKYKARSPFAALRGKTDAAKSACDVVALRSYLVLFVFASVNVAQIGNSVVTRVAVDVVNLALWILAVIEHPSEAMKLVMPTIKRHGKAASRLISDNLTRLPPLARDFASYHARIWIKLKKFLSSIYRDNVSFTHTKDYIFKLS